MNKTLMFLFADTDKKGAITNGFAIVANLGMAMAWGPVQTLTIETFPTVIRYFTFPNLTDNNVFQQC